MSLARLLSLTEKAETEGSACRSDSAKRDGLFTQLRWQMCVRTPAHVWSKNCSKLIPNPPLQPSTWDIQQSCPWTWQHTYMCHKRHKHNEQRRSKACRSQLRAYGECTSLKTYWWNQVVYLQKYVLYRKSKLIILMILPRNISCCCKLAWTEAKLRCLFPKAAYFTSIYNERLIISIPEWTT